MKTLLVTLLAASLAGNLALAVYSYRQETKFTAAVAQASGVAANYSAGPASSADTAAGASVTAANSGTTATGSKFPGARTDQEMRSVVAGLRAAGYPPSIVRAVVAQMLRERAERLNPSEERPFWKRGERQTPEQVAAQLALQKETQALREELLGPDGTPAAMLSANDRARRFGGLSDDKINALLKLDQEYNEVRSLAAAGPEAARGRDRGEQQRALEAEKRADLEAMLTPAELEQYDMRNSRTADRVQSAIRNVDVTEAEYAQLYQIQKAQEAANPSTRGEFNGAEGMVNRLVAQSEVNEQARAVLGEDRFLQYLEGADEGYAAAARFAAQQPNVSKAQTYQLYQLQNEMMLAMAGTRGNQGGAPTAERMTELRAMAATYNERLTRLLGSEAATAYKEQGPGRMLNALTQGGGRRRNGPGGN